MYTPGNTYGVTRSKRQVTVVFVGLSRSYFVVPSAVQSRGSTRIPFEGFLSPEHTGTSVVDTLCSNPNRQTNKSTDQNLFGKASTDLLSYINNRRGDE